MTTKKFNIVANHLAGYEAKMKVHNGSNHYVVPVTMIVEGVLNGSHGPLLHLAEDFGKLPESWNGIPVTINHPQVNGVSVSANTPEIAEKAVGRVFNAHMAGNKLKAEVWAEETKLSAISPETLANIAAGVEMEVSVGVYTNDEAISGEYNGIKYNAIARNHIPDHLALLPCGVGACSLDDGCGLGVNKNNKEGGSNVNEEQVKTFKALNAEGYAITPIVVNADGLRERLDHLREMVNGLDTNETYHYLEEAYDSFVVYEQYAKEQKSKLMKRAYSVNAENGAFEFTGDPVEVEKEITYVVKPKTNELIRTKFNNNSKKENTIMADNTKCPKCAQKINELISNEAFDFTEEDRPMLEALDQKVLMKMGVNATTTPAPAPEQKKEETPVVNSIQTLSAEDRAALDFGRKMLAQRKAEMKAGIVANTAQGTWLDAELDAMSEVMLEKLYKSTVKEAPVIDYSLNGNNKTVTNKSNEVEPLLPNIN